MQYRRFSGMPGVLGTGGDAIPMVSSEITRLITYQIPRGGTFYKMLGLYLMFHARFIHATLIGVMLNFWKAGVAPTTPLYTKTPPLQIPHNCLYLPAHPFDALPKISKTKDPKTRDL